MDYHRKYLKYKIKYLELKEQIGNGTKKYNEVCKDDRDCDKNLYCSKGLIKNICKSRKLHGSNCERNRQCIDNLQCEKNKCKSK